MRRRRYTAPGVLAGDDREVERKVSPGCRRVAMFAIKACDLARPAGAPPWFLFGVECADGAIDFYSATLAEGIALLAELEPWLVPALEKADRERQRQGMDAVLFAVDRDLRHTLAALHAARPGVTRTQAARPMPRINVRGPRGMA